MIQKTNKNCVLSICDIYPKRLGSFEEFLIALTEKLNENNFEHIIVFREKPIKEVEEILNKSGAKIHILKTSSYNPYNFFKFYNLFNKFKPKIVHFHFFPTYTVVNYLKFFFNIKIIYTDHMGGRKAKSILKRGVLKFFLYINSKLFDYGLDQLICVSNFVKLKYSKEYGIRCKKIVVIYNGINLKRYQRKTDITELKNKYNLTDEFVITCVGLRRDKGAHVLIKAIPLILNQIPNIKLILIGDDTYKNHLECLIKKYDIINNVLFVRTVSDMSDIYSISSCVIIPSLFEEAFCFVAAEAMAAETSVIAFDSGAIKEVVYDTNYIIPKNYIILSSKIIECLKNNAFIQPRNRLHVIENFSLDKCISNHFKLYEKLVSINYDH